jgi:plasmid stabilization system protein ParE
MNTRVSARARDDLAGIVAYICSRQGEKAGDRFVALAEQAVSFLSKNPQAGPHPRWRTRHKTLRFWVISRTNHLIYYFADESGVSIERVLDGRRT